MKNPKPSLNMVLFVLPLCVLGSLNLISPNKPTISQLENRALAAKPAFSREKLVSGDLFREYDNYFADTFVFRDALAKASRQINSLRGWSGEKATIVTHNGANVGQAQGADSAGQVSVSGRVLVYEDKAMEMHTFNAASSDYYARFINELQAALGNQVHAFSLLAPTQIEFMPQPELKGLSASQRDTIDYVDERLDPKVTPVDAYSQLKQHADEYVYFRSDHHWTALGAYYAYTAFMSAQGETPVPLDRYQRGEISPYLGRLYSATLSSKVSDHPDVITYYRPFVPHQYDIYFTDQPVPADLIDLSQASESNKYGIFMGGDQPLTKITTNVRNGKKIAVIKDSYANAFVPFLLPHYQEIYVIDPRQYTHNLLELVKQNGIQNVLVLNYSFITENNAFTDLMREMITR